MNETDGDRQNKMRSETGRERERDRYKVWGERERGVQREEEIGETKRGRKRKRKTSREGTRGNSVIYRERCWDREADIDRGEKEERVVQRDRITAGRYRRE